MRTIGARWVFPGTSPPIPHGLIAIDGQTIVQVGPADRALPVDLDLGDVAILPGFVNAHTHLDLGPISWDEATGPEDEIEWLGRVIRSRFDATPAVIVDRIRRNLLAAVGAGTTALADISAGGQSWSAVASTPVWGTVFAEILGLSPARSGETWQAALNWLSSLPPIEPGAQTRPGLSPHAPYSTAGSLYHNAAQTGLPLTTHLGEMPAEREFLTNRSGPLQRFVASLGAWVEDWQPLGCSPVDYVTADPTLQQSDWIVAHGNIFDPAEFARLIPHRNDSEARRVAVAYCPRTHARFGHPPHPFRAMLAAGVVVCLGTDSLASTPTLSILDEVRFLHRHHPDVAGATLLKMATIHGAWALRIDDRTGSLEPGKSADLTILNLGSGDLTADPYSCWLKDTRPPLATMWRGRIVAGQNLEH